MDITVGMTVVGIPNIKKSTRRAHEILVLAMLITAEVDLLKNSTKALFCAAITTAIMTIAMGSASALSIRVSQESSAGGGDFNANILGFVDVFSTGLTASGFYKYNVGDAASYNGDDVGGPAPVSSLTQTFFVSASDGIAMFTVHDSPNDGSGGSADMVTLLSQAISGAQNLGDGEAVGETPVGGGPSYTTTHDWIACCTDGFVIGPLTSGMTILSEFSTLPTGITDWQITGDSASDIAFVLSAGRRVRYDVVTEPGTLAILGLGLSSLGFARRRMAA